MTAECMLCGRKMDNHGWDSKYARSIDEIRSQIENLDAVLVGLISGEETIPILLDERSEMCPMCRELFEGVVSEKDKDEVEKRLNECILSLEELNEQKLSGQI